jgi:PST family polysaccharide transporter
VLFSSLVLAVVFYFGFDLVVRLYPAFSLKPYAAALCALIPLTSVTTYFDSVQARQFKFKTVALIELFCTNLLQAVVSIVLALRGWGAWSLLIGFGFATLAKLVTQLATGMIAFARFDRSHTRIQRTSAWFLAIGIVNYAGRNGDNAIAGYLLGPAALGIYSRAFNLMMRPVTTMGGAVMSVFYPMLSSIGHETVRVRSAYLKALSLTAFLCLPTSAFACIYGDDIIGILFGRQWGGVSAPFKVLVAALYFRLAYRVTETVAFSRNALRGATVRQTVYGAAVVLGSIIGSSWGVTGIATGVTLALLLFFLLSSAFANRLSHTTLSEFLRAHIPGSFVALVVAAGTAILRACLPPTLPSFISLCIGLALFIALYCGLTLWSPSFFFRGSAMEPIRSSLKRRLSERLRGLLGSRS